VTPDNAYDNLLMGRVMAGDTEAFNTLRSRFIGLVRHIASKYRVDSDEAVAAVFLKVWTKASGYQSNAAVHTWIGSIATFYCIDELRKAPRRATLPLFSAEEVPLGEGRDLFAVLDTLGDWELSDRERKIVGLYVLGNQWHEVADVLGLTIPTVKSVVHRMRQRLTQGTPAT
jgi:RNA polymerase sigma factor (sigma-70 family)